MKALLRILPALLLALLPFGVVAQDQTGTTSAVR